MYNCTDIAYAPYREYWRNMRKICTLELLSAKRVQKVADIHKNEVNQFVNLIFAQAGSEINLIEMLHSLAYKITSLAAFGSSVSDKTYVPILRESTKLGSGLTLVDLFPSSRLLRVMSGMKGKLEKLHRELDKIVQKIIDEHRENRRKRYSKGDLVDAFLDYQENEVLGFQLTANNIKAVIQDIFFGRTETSTTVICAMSELLKNPNIMKKAQKAVRQAFKSKGHANELGIEDLKFLKLVIKETFRLHPPVPLLVPRKSRERCEIKGHEIPVKARVIVNAWAIGKDSKTWEDPERFYPERFLVDYKGQNFEYIQFGAGRTIRPGISFGIANVELPLANLLYHFDWKLPNDLKLENLDMSEKFGASVGRNNDLRLVPIVA